jgi:hypothetical protein
MSCRKAQYYRLKRIKIWGEIKDAVRHSRVKFANLMLNAIEEEDNFYGGLFLQIKQACM